MKHLFILAAGAALMMMTVVSCGKLSEVSGDDADNTYKPLELSTKAAGFVEKGSTFTFDFIDRINTEADADYVISPLSMQFLLGMLLDGAKGETSAQISKVLGYGAGEVEEVNKFCLSMLQQLPELDNKTKINIGNAIFLDDGYQLQNSYKKTVSKYFQAEASNLNFANSEASLKAINGWASKQTNGLIPKVLDDVSPSILAYLLNALYFKSEWTNQFPKSGTGNETFVDENGEKRSVEMMKMDTKAAYFENDEYQAVRMPYGNGAYSMTVYLPKEGSTVADITAMLKKDGFRSLTGERDVDIWFPKFETKFKIELKDILSEMGMPIAFAGADFSAMASGAASLAFVQQDAVIKVDEEGSEAAAVSVAAVEKSAIPGGGRAVFHADHTFFYIISEKSTGAVLFAGRYSGK